MSDTIGGDKVSEIEKGEIMQQMAKLPPILQAKAEGFVKGLLTGTDGNRSASQADQEKDEKGARNDG